MNLRDSKAAAVYSAFDSGSYLYPDLGKNRLKDTSEHHLNAVPGYLARTWEQNSSKDDLKSVKTEQAVRSREESSVSLFDALRSSGWALGGAAVTLAALVLEYIANLSLNSIETKTTEAPEVSELEERSSQVQTPSYRSRFLRRRPQRVPLAVRKTWRVRAQPEDRYKDITIVSGKSTSRQPFPFDPISATYDYSESSFPSSSGYSDFSNIADHSSDYDYLSPTLFSNTGNNADIYGKIVSKDDPTDRVNCNCGKGQDKDDHKTEDYVYDYFDEIENSVRPIGSGDQEYNLNNWDSELNPEIAHAFQKGDPFQGARNLKQEDISLGGKQIKEGIDIGEDKVLKDRRSEVLPWDAGITRYNLDSLNEHYENLAQPNSGPERTDDLAKRQKAWNDLDEPLPSQFYTNLDSAYSHDVYEAIPLRYSNRLTSQQTVVDQLDQSANQVGEASTNQESYYSGIIPGLRRTALHFKEKAVKDDQTTTQVDRRLLLDDQSKRSYYQSLKNRIMGYTSDPGIIYPTVNSYVGIPG